MKNYGINKFRWRLLQKLSQQGAQAASPVTNVPPPTLPSILIAHLHEGYNGATVQLIVSLVQQLNAALHYASNGQDNFQKIIDNNLDLSGAASDEKNIGALCKRMYITFLNSRNAFTSKVTGKNITTWATAIVNSPEYNNLSQINPTGILATKLHGNLKSIILDYMNQIKQQNTAIL